MMTAPVSPSLSSAASRSGRVFGGLLVLVLIALAFPEMPVQGLLGIVWAGAGLLMMALPPENRLPRAWVLLAVGFVGLAALGFLPRGWFPVSPWRVDLEALGLDTGPCGFIEPLAAVEALAGFAVTAVVVMFMLGHRTDTARHHWLMLAFALGIGVWTVAALLLREPGGVFGLFPNRNHTATLLAMASIAGLGSLVQAIRQKDAWKIAWSVPPTLLTVWVLFAVSESRAGVVLLGIGFAAWVLLAGARAFRGNAGKALILLVIAVVGAFLIVDSTVKKRLAETVEKIAPTAAVPAGDGTGDGVETGGMPEGGPESPFAGEQEAVQPEPKMDARLSIFRAALGMVAKEPWTGVGPGRFASVFTQHRESADAPNNSRFLHPESDWLMMLAETGWAAMTCLVAGVAAVFFLAIRQARRGRARFLKTAGIVSALVLCIHGIFDVPGHRIGLAWAAALMLAMSLRPAAYVEHGETAAVGRRPMRGAWRLLGLVVFASGAVLLAAQWSQRPLLPTVRARQHMQNAKDLYDQDQAAYDKATAEGRHYDPPADQDPLVAALREVEQAIRITPLDPHTHHIQGALALHYDDKQEIARRAFAIQRRLDPFRVNVAIEQARAWMEQSPEESRALWSEAMDRARAHQARFPDGPEWIVTTYRAALGDAGKNEALSHMLLELAGTDAALIAQWANAAPLALLDAEMPRLMLDVPLDGADRRPLYQTWLRRGSKTAAQAFAADHPGLELVAP